MAIISLSLFPQFQTNISVLRSAVTALGSDFSFRFKLDRIRHLVEKLYSLDPELKLLTYNMVELRTFWLDPSNLASTMWTALNAQDRFELAPLYPQMIQLLDSTPEGPASAQTLSSQDPSAPMKRLSYTFVPQTQDVPDTPGGLALKRRRMERGVVMEAEGERNLDVLWSLCSIFHRGSDGTTSATDHRMIQSFVSSLNHNIKPQR